MTIFWQIVTGILASVGGVAGLIIIIVKVFSNTIAERLSKKYELKLTKEVEKYKGQYSFYKWRKIRPCRQL